MSSVSLSKSSLDSPTAPESRVKSDDKDSLSASLSSLVDGKDRRTYEHVRQKVKKAADTVKMRTQKRSPPRSKPADRKPPRSKGGGRLSDEDDTFDAVLVNSVNRGDVQERVVSSDVLKVDVKLADLVMTRKPPKRNDSDFEVIPHLRSVIVLDDVATRDVAVNEPWEHIYGQDDDTPVKAPTYATVLSSNK